MTVEKMIKILKLMPQDANVCIFDTYWEVEDWEEDWIDGTSDSLWNEVDCINYDNNKHRVELY